MNSLLCIHWTSSSVQIKPVFFPRIWDPGRATREICPMHRKNVARALTLWISASIKHLPLALERKDFHHKIMGILARCLRYGGYETSSSTIMHAKSGFVVAWTHTQQPCAMIWIEGALTKLTGLSRKRSLHV